MRLLLLLPLLPGTAFAAPDRGYVVRVDTRAVYLDLGEDAGAAAGRPFAVYVEGAELKHPVTGESLGKTETIIAQGRITEVHPKYSVGALDAPNAEVKAGSRARLGAAASPAPQPATTDNSRAPRWKSPPFDYKIEGMAVADFLGDGRRQLALADNKKVYLYPYPPDDAKPIAEYEQPGSAPRILTLEAGDVNGNGKAELFASMFNQVFNRFETVILEIDGGRWKKMGELPWLVRSHQDSTGKPLLAVQQIVDDATFPFSSFYPLALKDGRYAAGSGAIRPKRVDWIYDFNEAAIDGKPATFYLTSTGRVRIQFEKGYWKTSDSYGQTPTRVRWHDKLLEFHPPMPVSYDGGKTSLFLIRNISMLGSLSEPFGLFNSAELEKGSWNGIALSTDWKASLGGYSPSLALVEREGRRELAVAVVGSAGKSSVWIYDP